MQVALEVAPVSDEYLPTEQGKHAVEVLLPLNGLYLPAEHKRHTDGSVAPVAALYLPAEHCEHAALPCSVQFGVQGLEEPEGQQQSQEPVLVEYEPALQRMVYVLVQQRGGSAGVHTPTEAVPKGIKRDSLQSLMDPCAR